LTELTSYLRYTTNNTKSKNQFDFDANYTAVFRGMIAKISCAQCPSRSTAIRIIGLADNVNIVEHILKHLSLCGPLANPITPRSPDPATAKTIPASGSLESLQTDHDGETAPGYWCDPEYPLAVCSNGGPRPGHGEINNVIWISDGCKFRSRRK